MGYRCAPETVAKVLLGRVRDRTRGAWPQSLRALWGAVRIIVGAIGGFGGGLRKVEMRRGGPQLSPNEVTWERYLTIAADEICLIVSFCVALAGRDTSQLWG